MNPVTGTIAAATVPTAGTPHTGHENSTTSPAPTSAIVVVTQTVTAAAVANQPGINTTTTCPSSLVL